MPIEFLDLLDDDGWAPVPSPVGRPGHRWSDGGSLADAPVDADATLEGSAHYSTRIDPDFGLLGVRMASRATSPRRSHNQDVQRIVFGGSLTIEFDDDSGPGVVEVGPGQFATVEADTPYRLVAGPDGVTFTECWPLKAADLETTWYPDPTWVPR